MIRSVSQTANPSADAAAMLRRLGFAILPYPWRPFSRGARWW
jgi:hypothetical protein